MEGKAADRPLTRPTRDKPFTRQCMICFCIATFIIGIAIGIIIWQTWPRQNDKRSFGQNRITNRGRINHFLETRPKHLNT